MLQRQAIRLRMLPTKAQLMQLERIAGCCRAIYNTARDQRRWFARPGCKISYASQAGEIAAFREAYPWLGEAPHHCLQQALVDLEAAYKNFWAGRCGAPQPRKRGIDDAFRFPDPAQVTLEGNLRVPDKRRTRSIKTAALRLPKLGAVRCVLHRAVPTGSRILSITVSRDAGHWLASVLMEREIAAPTDRSTEAIVGIDLAGAHPVALSTGEKFELPRVTAGARAHLARLQQRVWGKMKGSANRRKAVGRLAAFKARQARRRCDAMEKVTTAIAKNHGVVAMVDQIVTKSLAKGGRANPDGPQGQLARMAEFERSILDFSPGAFRVRLGQKLAASGGVQLLVPPASVHSRCSHCGNDCPGDDVVCDRFVCLACGVEAEAAENAAANLRDRARGLWGDARSVKIAASTSLLLMQQEKPKLGFRKSLQEAGGRPASACRTTGIRHAQGRKWAAATLPSGAGVRPAKSSAVGRE